MACVCVCVCACMWNVGRGRHIGITAATEANKSNINYLTPKSITIVHNSALVWAQKSSRAHSLTCRHLETGRLKWKPPPSKSKSPKNNRIQTKRKLIIFWCFFSLHFLGRIFCILYSLCIGLLISVTALIGTSEATIQSKSVRHLVHSIEAKKRPPSCRLLYHLDTFYPTDYLPSERKGCVWRERGGAWWK